MRKLLIIFCLLTPLMVHAKEKAKWITNMESQSATNTWISFRKDFNIKDLPNKISARIAADSKYWLWVNGQLVVLEGSVKRGPNPQDTYFDEIDMAPYLHAGDNSIAVLLWYFGKQGFSYNPSGVAGLFFECEPLGLVSDKTWRSVMNPAFYTPGGELPNFRLSESNIGYDARASLEGWTDAKTTVTSQWPWMESLELGVEGCAPWNKLHPRIIPMWKDFGLKEYVSVKRNKGKAADTLVCKLPYNAQVMPFFRISSIPGQPVKVFTDHYRGGSAPNIWAEYITRGGIQCFECLGWMNGQNVYYVVPTDCKIEKIAYRETGYNTEFAGSFTCNDSFYNEMWKKAQRTLYITMRDTYMDCPDRERAQWWGDAVNELGEAFYALSTSSHLLAKKGMYELIGWQRPDGVIFSPVPASNYCTELPAQMLASVGEYGFWNYYLHTSDRQTIADLYEGVKRYLDVWQYDSLNTVIFRSGDWNWGDWGTNIDLLPLINAWYYIALQGQLNMASLLDNQEDMRAISLEMEQLSTAFNKRFWNGRTYIDPQFDGVADDRVQALAVLSGLASEDKYKSIYQTIKSTEYASPYMEKYVLEALFKMNKPEYALCRMKKRFGEMVNDTLHTTLFEGWGIGPNGFGGGTTNHAWSGGALTLLSQYVCGITPIEAGYELFSVKPMLGGLKNVATEMETVKGNIKVAVEKSDNRFVLDVTVPQNTKALIGIPNSMQRNIKKNGASVSKKDAQEDKKGGYLLFPVGPGEWKFESLK